MVDPAVMRRALIGLTLLSTLATLSDVPRSFAAARSKPGVSITILSVGAPYSS
jgi:hypothetical protein